MAMDTWVPVVRQPADVAVQQVRRDIAYDPAADGRPQPPVRRQRAQQIQQGRVDLPNERPGVDHRQGGDHVQPSLAIRDLPRKRITFLA